MTILTIQMTQISNMKVIGFMVDFKQIVKLWHLSIEFCGEWQKVATHHHKIKQGTSFYMYPFTINAYLPRFVGGVFGFWLG